MVLFLDDDVLFLDDDVLILPPGPASRLCGGAPAAINSLLTVVFFLIAVAIAASSGSVAASLVVGVGAALLMWARAGERERGEAEVQSCRRLPWHLVGMPPLDVVQSAEVLLTGRPELVGSVHELLWRVAVPMPYDDPDVGLWRSDVAQAQAEWTALLEARNRRRGVEAPDEGRGSASPSAGRGGW